MQNYNILWADDEIELLKPHILFLEKKGYQITPVTSGVDAIDRCEQENFDVVFLDENMPGMTGIETLSKIKSIQPSLPVVMITKSEEEDIMEQAIGSRIDDYLIKPLNPNQILLSVKKILDNKRLVSERTNQEYQQDFRNISMAFGEYMDHKDWTDIYRKLIKWELEIDKSSDKSMLEILNMQKEEANKTFANFIEDNYQDWINESVDDVPLMSHNVMNDVVFEETKKGKPVFLFVIDNLRVDQWKVLEPFFSEMFQIEEESTYYSILPTTTAYSRNSLFSGLLPSEIQKKYPQFWVGEDQEEGKNNHEDELLEALIRRKRLDLKFSYHKIKNTAQGKSLSDSVLNLMGNDLNVVVYNFVDMLSHARTEMEMIRELAPDEPAYRSITVSWFLHSPLYEIFKKLKQKDVKVIVTTDHGTIRVKKPYKIIGDRNTNTNLRYKQGKNLAFDEGGVFFSRTPEKLGLPKTNVSTSYAFALPAYFFAYPNNYNYYVKYYTDTFQHGGISLEEILIPIVCMNSKNGG
ncbi:MAG: PglZ domain-containing protein [Bacteroidota bacterium]